MWEPQAAVWRDHCPELRLGLGYLCFLNLQKPMTPCKWIARSFPYF